MAASGVAQALASIPGYRGLLYDIDPIPRVVNKPRARVGFAPYFALFCTMLVTYDMFIYLT